MINEKLLYLGISYKERLLDIYDTYGYGYTSYSLKTGVKKYCNVELDKSVRGKIIRVGITPDTIVYAANDVKYEPMLLDKQMEALEKKNIVKAADFENLFIRSLVYYKFCGVKLDIPRWKIKMEKDKKEMNIQINKLNTWIYDFYNKHKIANNWIRLEIDVNRRTLGKEESLFKVPEYFIPIKGRNIERVDDDGVAWRYDVGTYDIPFGQIRGKPEYISKLINSCKNKTIKEFNILLRKNFKPYIGKDVQLDLFSEANTEEHCIINWSSPSSIVPLFELLGFNVLTFDKKTKKEKKSVSEKIITPQIKVCPEFANPYINYKKAFKVVSSYGQNWIDQIDVDGRIHPEYNQLGTATARVSSGKGNDDNDSEEDKDDKSINIQNLPRDSETRACFISEKGNSWISEDYQSQESQIMASVTNDPAMLKFYREGGGDMHSLVAKMSYPDKIPKDTPIPEVGKLFPKLRQDAKKVEFAIDLLFNLLNNFVALYGNIKKN